MRRFDKIPVPLLFLVITALFFNSYFFRGKPLFPGNLLVSFYSPWKYEVFPGWEHGIPHKPLGFDNLRFFYPTRTEVLKQFQEGKLPLWNPYNFSGNVLLGDSQSAVLYPLNILFFLLPFMHAWSLLVVFVPLIAGTFTYLFLRTYKPRISPRLERGDRLSSGAGVPAFKLSKISSLFGGVSFAFSGFMIVWMEENPAVSHSAIWLPVALYAIKNFINQKSILFWFLAIFALVSSILAGFLQIAIYLWIFSLSYTIYEFVRLINTERRKLIFPLIGIFFLSFLISAIQLIPSFEAFLSSPRITASTDYLFREYLLPLSSLMTLVVPDIFGNPGTHNFFFFFFYYDKILYVGLIPLIFALYALFNQKKPVSFFIFWAFISLALGFNNLLSKLVFGLKIPFFSTVTPSRIFYLFAFCVSILAAFGLQRWLEQHDRTSPKKVIYSVGALFALSLPFIVLRLIQMIGPTSIEGMVEKVSLFLYPGIIFKPKQAMISLRNLFIPSGVFLIVIVLLLLWTQREEYGKWILMILLVLFVFHQYYFFQKSIYFSEREFIFPETVAIGYLKENSGLDRIVGVGQARVFPNLLLPYRFFSPEGLDPVFPRRYGELISAVNTGVFTVDIPRIETRLILDEDKDFENETKLKALSFLGVKFLLVPKYDEENPRQEIILPPNQFKKVWEKDGLDIWQNNTSFPRCWFVDNYTVRSKPQEIIETMFSDGFDLRNKVVLEEDPPLKLIPQTVKINRNDGEVEIMEYNADTIKIKIDIATDGILFCTENFSPGWQAKIDGKETKIYRADYTFRVVTVPAGVHEIIFSYEPLSLKYGAIISALGLLIAGTYGAVLRKKVSL